MTSLHDILVAYAVSLQQFK